MADFPYFSREWFSAHFDTSGKKQVDLVDFMRERGLNIDATKLSKSIKGTRALRPEERTLVMEFFGYGTKEIWELLTRVWNARDNSNSTRSYHFDHVDESDADADTSTKFSSMGNAVVGRSIRRKKILVPNAGLPEHVGFSPEKLPIFGVSLGGNAKSATLFNGDMIGSTDRPRKLADVPDAYATYVHGESMEPRYEAGEIVIVNPSKPYKKGNYVVAQIYEDDNDPPYGYVKRFISFGDELVLEQLNPPQGEDRFMRFPRDRVLSVHRIVGTLDE